MYKLIPTVMESYERGCCSIIKLQTGERVYANNVGFTVWNYLFQKDYDEIIRIVMSEFSIQKDFATESVTEFINQLLEKEIIQYVETSNGNGWNYESNIC